MRTLHMSPVMLSIVPCLAGTLSLSGARGVQAQVIDWGNTAHQAQVGFERRSSSGETLEEGFDSSIGDGCPADVGLTAESKNEGTSARLWVFGGVEESFVRSECGARIQASPGSGWANANVFEQHEVFFAFDSRATVPVDIDLFISDVERQRSGLIQLLDADLNELVRVEVGPGLGRVDSFHDLVTFEPKQQYRIVTSINATVEAGEFSPGSGVLLTVNVQASAGVGSGLLTNIFRVNPRIFLLCSQGGCRPLPGEGIEMTVIGSFDALDEEICGIYPFDQQAYRTLTRMDLTIVEEFLTLPLPDGTELVLSNGRVTLAFPGLPALIDADGRALLPAGVQIEFDAEVVDGVASGTPFALVYVLFLECMSQGWEDDGFPGEATLTFPDVQLILALDVGLGENNPILQITGDLVGTLAPPCPEDIDGSGDVGFSDVLAILEAWGNVGGPEDLDDSGTVDFGDLLMVLAAWGPCDP